MGSKIMKARILAGWFLAPLVCTLVAQAQITGFNAAPGTISGSVMFAADNRAASGIKVEVRSFTGEPVATVVTSWEGDFQIGVAGSGTYIVTVQEPGFEPVQQVVDVHLGFRSLLWLYLRRASVSPADHPGYKVSVRELTIPDKARKEYEKGLKCLAKNDPAGSLAHFNRAAAAFSKYFEAHYQIGVADLKLGREEEAEQAFQKSVDLSEGRYPEPQLALGLLLCQRRQYAEAEAIMRRESELVPDSWASPFVLAWALLGLNRLDEADRNVHTAIERKPDFAPAHLLRANIRVRRRDYATVLRELDTFLKLQPDGALTSQVRQFREQVERAWSNSGQTLTGSASPSHESSESSSNWKPPE